MVPFFSIIVPVYQSKKSLERTVERLQKQTFLDIEIILVDDGSTDDSAIICDKLANKDKRIVVVHKSNGGVSSARNEGIKISRGKWVIFVDSDDLVSLKMCEDFLSYTQKFPVVDFVACNFALKVADLINTSSTDHEVLYLKNKKQNIDLIKQMLVSNFKNSSEDFRQSFGSNIVLNSPCGKAYKRSFLIKNHLVFQEKIKYSEDLLFNIEFLSNNAKGIFVNDAVYFYTYNTESVTHQDYYPNIIDNYYIFKKVVEKIIQKNEIPELQTAIDIFSFKSALGIMRRDIFIPENTVSKSKDRMQKILISPKFHYMCNKQLLNKYRKLFNIKIRILGTLLLNNKFWILLICYKIFQK